MSSLYHMCAMRLWCLVFHALLIVGHRPAFEWALNKAGKHSGWLMLEEDRTELENEGHHV